METTFFSSNDIPAVKEEIVEVSYDPLDDNVFDTLQTDDTFDITTISLEIKKEIDELCCYIKDEIDDYSTLDYNFYRTGLLSVIKEEIDLDEMPCVFVRPLQWKQSDGSTFFVCPICDSFFQTNLQLSYHVSSCPKSKTKLLLRARENMASDRLWNKAHRPSKGKDKPIPSKDNRYTCTVCCKTFTTKNNFQLHQNIHTGKKPHSCSICKKTFLRKASLTIHVRQVHTDERPFTCSNCGKSFALKVEVKKHIERTHNGMKPFVCSICNKSFSLKCNMRDHILIHSGEKPFKCKDCGKPFSNHRDLKRHVLRVHTTEKPFPCSFCIKRFARKQDTNKHVLFAHTKRNPYSCSVCSYKCPWQCNLNDHMQRVHSSTRPYLCSLCVKAFALERDLKKHIQLIHTSANQYSCFFCGKTFARKGSIRRHLKHKHNTKMNRPKNTTNVILNSVNCRNKGNNCPQCDGVFSRKCDLKRHVVPDHNVETPYACSLCDKALGQKKEKKRCTKNSNA